MNTLYIISAKKNSTSCIFHVNIVFRKVFSVTSFLLSYISHMYEILICVYLSHMFDFIVRRNNIKLMNISYLVNIHSYYTCFRTTKECEISSSTRLAVERYALTTH